MATIHVLKPVSALCEAQAAEQPRRSAEIILFPGVRYERWADAGKPVSAADKQKRKRRSRVKRDKMTINV
jgi:hypothetical protein